MHIVHVCIHKGKVLFTFYAPCATQAHGGSGAVVCEHTHLSCLTFSGFNKFNLPRDPKGEDTGRRLPTTHPCDRPEQMCAPKHQAPVTQGISQNPSPPFLGYCTEAPPPQPPLPTQQREEAGRKGAFSLARGAGKLDRESESLNLGGA